MKYKIGILGLGYVGAPLFNQLGVHFDTVGFDIDPRKITHPKTSSKEEILKDCNVYIIATPTPLKNGAPDLSYLLDASKTLSKFLRDGDLVIYESTTYPTCTRDVCAKVLNLSGAKYLLGYSPERISPGRGGKRLDEIVKIISADSREGLAMMREIYGAITKVYEANSIEIAEAAKLVENVQRDVNIAFVNEMAKLFDVMGLDTSEILKAASTKWNFAQFTPGLVGGHCIAVDPHYLMHIAYKHGFTPTIIQSAREVNESMALYIVDKLLRQEGLRDIAILGATFKENCDDMRNAKAIDIAEILREKSLRVDIYDPLVESVHLESMSMLNSRVYDGVIILQPHDEFLELNFNFVRDFGVVFDVKSRFSRLKGRFRVLEL